MTTNEHRQVMTALWTPAITTVGAVLVAVISAWSGCTDVQRDVEKTREDVTYIRNAVERNSRAIEHVTQRLEAIDK